LIISFDTKGKLPGNGTTFDWKVLKISFDKPFFSAVDRTEELKAVNKS
jgi:hypothetical protein